MKKKILSSLVLSTALFSANSFALEGGFSLDENAKLRSAYPAVTGKMLADNCSACHGTMGAEFNEAMPPLAGMKKENFLKQMKAYRANEMPSIIMRDVAYVFSDEELEAMADYFAAQPAVEWTQPEWNKGVTSHE